MKRVAILISGGGSNMVRLVASMSGDHPARCCLVLSNVVRAGGLARAQDLGVPAEAMPHQDFPNRNAFEVALTERLNAAGADLICLAGFMRVLTPTFTERWSGRVLNIHPSLLPKYPGLRTHARALESGDREAGCTVHEVTAELDAGPILGQASVPIEMGDTSETLADRVLKAEHRLYPRVLRRVAEGDRSRLDLTWSGLLQD